MLAANAAGSALGIFDAEGATQGSWAALTPAQYDLGGTPATYVTSGSAGGLGVSPGNALHEAPPLNSPNSDASGIPSPRQQGSPPELDDLLQLAPNSPIARVTTPAFESRVDLQAQNAASLSRVQAIDATALALASLFAEAEGPSLEDGPAYSKSGSTTTIEPTLSRNARERSYAVDELIDVPSLRAGSSSSSSAHQMPVAPLQVWAMDLGAADSLPVNAPQSADHETSASLPRASETSELQESESNNFSYDTPPPTPIVEAPPHPRHVAPTPAGPRETTPVQVRSDDLPGEQAPPLPIARRDSSADSLAFLALGMLVWQRVHHWQRPRDEVDHPRQPHEMPL
ncbi:MAG: hypothetical protein KDA61_08590 [Planctomycetales bacterium]|nr:hypothetical protein [Planctomycetales bacterium]